MQAERQDELLYVVKFRVKSAPAADTWRAQAAYQTELAAKGVLLMCGPLTDERGLAMAIIRADGREAATNVYRNAPIVLAGHAEFSAEPWTVSIRAEQI